MPNAVSVTAPLLIGLVLMASAVGKLRAPERARAAFSALGVPKPLDRAWVARVHPWAEIALAVLLVVVPGPVGVGVAAAAVALMLVYLGLVVRALRSPLEVDCACFGALGGDLVTKATVWRNAWLTVIALTALWCSLEGRSVASRLGALSAAEWWWLLAAVATGLTVALVLGGGRTQGAQVEPQPLELAYGDEGDYVRSRTPALPVQLADGTRTDLRKLSRERAQLLIFVSEGCASCVDIISAVPGWRRDLPQLDVRLVISVQPEVSRLTSSDEPQTIHDVDGWIGESFATRSTPSAMLLGADGLLAGGPVVGRLAVPEFVAEIRQELGVQVSPDGIPS